MRRQRITFTTLLLTTAFILATAVTSFAAPLPGGTLDPLTVPKYMDPLPIPGVMPQTTAPPGLPAGVDYYEIAVRQFQQQVLSTGTVLPALPAGAPPMTTVWGYGSVNDPATFGYPARSIESTVNRPVRVKWLNQLVSDPVACAASASPATDPACNFVPHLLPVDQTLHWANPPQDCIDDTTRPDCRGKSQLSYTGPVPVVTHLHGAHVQPDSDGYPEAWWLPAANNIPTGYATQGSNFTQIPDAPVEPGAALYQYRNDQRATALWFHDHSVGMTRSNVYAGPAGFYFLRGGAADVPTGVPGGLPGGAYEIPLVIQDRSFNADGSLFYPDSRLFFDGYAGPYIGDPGGVASDAAPLHNPEFFGNTMVVNGKTWPFLEVEPRKYRLRILNASDSRFLILRFPSKVKAKFTVIGTEGGFLPTPVTLSQLLIGPAERFDVIVDFTGMKPGAVFNLLNVGPDSPFGGAFPASGQADARTTGQVMQLRVVALTVPDTSAIPTLPTITPVGAPSNIRQVSLNEAESSLICVDKNNVFVPGVSPATFCSKRSAPLAPVMAQLGTIDPLTGLGIPLAFDAPITENPGLNSTEEWEISNFTADAHPIHLHLVMFQVVNRQSFGGVARLPEVWETGFKDTVVSYPGEITRVKAFYDIEGLFLWHCHILSHEDNEMMRPYCVGDLANCQQ